MKCFTLSFFFFLCFLRVVEAKKAVPIKVPFTAIELHFQICGAQGAVLSQEDLNKSSSQSNRESQEITLRWDPKRVLGLTLESLNLSAEGNGSEVFKTQTVYFLDVEDKSRPDGQFFFNSRNVILRVRENDTKYQVSIKNRVPVTKAKFWTEKDSLKRDSAVSRLFDLAGRMYLTGANETSCEFDFIKTRLSMSCTSSAEYIKKESGDQIAQIVRTNDGGALVSQSQRILDTLMGKGTAFGDFLSQVVGASNALPIAEVRPVGWAQRTFWKWNRGIQENVFEDWSLLSGKAEIEKLISMKSSTLSDGLSGRSDAEKGKDYLLPINEQSTQILEYSTRVILDRPPSRSAEKIETEIGQIAQVAWQGIATQLEKKGLILCDSPVSKTEFSAGRIK